MEKIKHTSVTELLKKIKAIFYNYLTLTGKQQPDEGAMTQIVTLWLCS